MKHSLIFIFFYFILTLQVYACGLPNTSVVYFKMFSTQAILPITKKDFTGMKMVIKSEYFKKLLENAKLTKSQKFFEDIRMTVNYEKNIYYINQQGDIELNDSVIGKLDKKTIDHLDLGNDLYEWGTCQPINEVLAKMLEEHNKHVEKLFKEQILDKKR
jgi:hypothetical protein